MFMFYTLTFFVPKFYGFTEKYVGLIVFFHLAVLTLININPIEKLKAKDRDFIVLCILAVVTALNLVLVGSGFGCFFVEVNFALIWYLSSQIKFSRTQLLIVGGACFLMVIYWFFFVYPWMFADYLTYAMNTNTAATFTVFTMLCVLVFLECVYERIKIAGLFIVIALVKCLQISLYHRSRGAFIMLGAFFVFRFLIPGSLWEKKGFSRFMRIFATLGSLLFVALYVIAGSSGINFRMPFFYKNIFSGREAIWLEFWNLFRKRPLTGIGTNVTITSFFEFNVHNAMYNILVIHGVIVFALTLYIMYRTWEKTRCGISKRRTALCAVTAIMAVCIESFFDVDLIWTNYSFNVLFLLLAMNTKFDKDTVDG